MSDPSSTSSFFASSTFSIPSPSPSESSSQPSRKRPRTESASEDRKDARAHRNRIAAQNSRDRRKAQFTYLEQRVKDLEDENRRLRAGVAPLPAPVTPPQTSERDRENEELRDRIKTLEAGWDAVVKALAAQGLSTGLLSPSAPAQTSPQPIPQPQIVEPVSHSMPATTLPITYPVSPAPTSPDSVMTSSPESSFLGLTEPTFSSIDANDSTRHLAAGGFYASLDDTQTFSADLTAETPLTTYDNATVESLLKEILTPAALSTSEDIMGNGLGDGLLSFGQEGWSHEEELQMQQMYLSLQHDTTDQSVGVF